MKFEQTDFLLQLQEIRSCLIILQKAAENESDAILPADICNYLEVAINKTNQMIKNFEEFTNNTIA